MATLASRTKVSIRSIEADVNAVLRRRAKHIVDHCSNCHTVQIKHSGHLALRQQAAVQCRGGKLGQTHAVLNSGRSLPACCAATAPTADSSKP